MASPLPVSAFTAKYESSGRIGTALVNQFFASIRHHFSRLPSPPKTILEVGCGAGYSFDRIKASIGDPCFVALDPSMDLLRAGASRFDGAHVECASAYRIPHGKSEFDLVLLLEVLEHLEDPRAALFEISRVCRGHVVISTPREPIWRFLNVARGKYLRDFGNTPGHIQHWSARTLRALISEVFDVVAVATPLPWTVVLARAR